MEEIRDTSTMPRIIVLDQVEHGFPLECVSAQILRNARHHSQPDNDCPSDLTAAFNSAVEVLRYQTLRQTVVSVICRWLINTTWLPKFFSWNHPRHISVLHQSIWRLLVAASQCGKCITRRTPPAEVLAEDDTSRCPPSSGQSHGIASFIFLRYGTPCR